MKITIFNSTYEVLYYCIILKFQNKKRNKNYPNKKLVNWLFLALNYNCYDCDSDNNYNLISRRRNILCQWNNPKWSESRRSHWNF